MTHVLVPFSTGVEEVEFTAIVDILRRAGVEVITASLDGGDVTGRSKITIRPDAALNAVKDENWEMIVLPGGQPNADLLRADARVKAIVQRLRDTNKAVAAICAAPAALAAYGVLGTQRVTSYPGTAAKVKELAPDAVYVDEAVVEDGFLTTSRGAGTAVEFALRLVARLCGEAKAAEIRTSIVA